MNKTTVELTAYELKEITQALELRYDQFSESTHEETLKRAERIEELVTRLLEIRRKTEF